MAEENYVILYRADKGNRKQGLFVTGEPLPLEEALQKSKTLTAETGIAHFVDPESSIARIPGTNNAVRWTHIPD